MLRDPSATHGRKMEIICMLRETGSRGNRDMIEYESRFALEIDLIARAKQGAIENAAEEVRVFKETLNKLITPIVRQAHYERNQHFTVRPELVEGLDQSFLKETMCGLSELSYPVRTIAGNQHEQAEPLHMGTPPLLKGPC